MKEVFSPKIIEEREEKMDISVLRKKSNSKTFPGWIIGKMKKARNENNIEIVFLLNEIYKKYCEFHRFESKQLIEIEIIEGWKGTDKIEVIKGFENDFIIKSHTKDKETGEIYSATHQIPFENVNRLFFWIKKWEVGESHKCYDFAEKLGERDWKEVWKKRGDVYFPKYYYPIKIMESLGFIKYYGRGVITRLK